VGPGRAFFAFLGTSGAIPSAVRDTTSLVFSATDVAILVDCGGSPAGRLRRVGVDPLALTHVVVTHIHADHAYGLPSLVHGLVMLGRTDPLEVACRLEHVDALRQLLELFGVWQRPGAFTTVLRGIALQIGARAFETGPFAVRTAPNDHGRLANFAIRVDASGAGSTVYSSDTAPCDAVVDLARGAETLIHEATFPHRHRGRFGVHSTAREAGEVAARAGVRRLILTHIEADYHGDVAALADEARAAFDGHVEVAQELVPYPL
jgi:ribonuclease Z